MNNRKGIRYFGIVLLALAVLLWLVFHFGLRYASKPDVLLGKVQQSILDAEFEINACCDSPSDYAQFEEKGLSLVVFHGDSLLYWNSNVVYPKLIRRRVPMGTDTLCNLLSGDYLVRSFEHQGLSYYVFKLVNCTYSIANQHSRKLFCLFPFVFDVDIKFDPRAESGYAIHNIDNEVLTRCEFVSNPSVNPVFSHIFVIVVCVCFLLGFLLLLSSFSWFQSLFDRFRKREQPKFFEIGIGVVLLLAVVFTFVYAQHRSNRENATMMEAAHRLIQKRDADFENAFLRFRDKLHNDSILHEMVFSESNVLADVVLGYAKALLFDEQMKSYTSSLTLCSEGEEMTIQPEGFVVNCDGYFADILKNTPNEKVGEGLFFIDYYSLDPNYLGVLNISSSDSTLHRTLYFEFYRPVIPEGFGFPKLLQDRNSLGAKDYSVACYRDTLLVYKNGRFMFPSFLGDLDLQPNTFKTGKLDKLFAMPYGEHNTLVLSVPRRGWSEITAPFCLVFLALLLPFVLLWLVFKSKPLHRSSSLRRKIQGVVLWTLLISFLAVGPVSVVYMRSLYNEKTATSQFETIRTLSLEMQKDLDFEHLLQLNSRETWSEILHQYASTFFTDINLYATDGKLVATTCEEIFDHFLQAPLMNAEAFGHMNGNKALYYIHEELLGQGAYESAYVPITDLEGNTLAYLNTPFFSSNSDLHYEILNFVLTYLNIILLLLGLALLFVLAVTRRLTQPLGLIQSKMRYVEIDKPNETIEWQSNDEIGSLIRQYNELVVKLEQSAAELQRTTTESAWRGVARQVAHEIKNSLTPMRLSLQMLQRAADKGADNIDDRIKRTSDTLIEQIDALSDIASSFSSYAKLPENDPKPLDLAELVGNVVNLYDNAENIVFSYAFDPSQNHTFLGDKTNLNSAVSNIVKNAVQAIGNKPDGQITVNLTASESKFLISIRDNGRGIKEEDKKHVFLPNFTTKTNGSGVGLSLTYNIIQSAGGRITFESEQDKGTEFVIELFKKDTGNK